MSQVVEIGSPRVFRLDEARSLLPLLRRITQQAEKKVRELGQKYSLTVNDEKKADIENNILKCVHEWQEKVKRLGVYPKGLWLIDFDNGSGYWCWRFDEPDIQYQHGYDEGFRKRKPICLEQS